MWLESFSIPMSVAVVVHFPIGIFELAQSVQAEWSKVQESVKYLCRTCFTKHQLYDIKASSFMLSKRFGKFVTECIHRPTS